MSAQLLAAVLTAAGALLGSVRAWRHAVRWRAALVALQWLAAGALYLFVFPPPAGAGGELAVLTRGASAAQRDALPRAVDAIALPEALACDTPDCAAQGTPRRVLRVPDLATALRAHPDATRLRVLGEGLPPRDLDAARGLALGFDPTPPATGFAALEAPAHVVAGRTWRLGGSVSAPAGARVQLRDPGDAVIGTVEPAADGAFAFDAPSRLPGPALFRLRLLGEGDKVLDELPVPLVAEPAQPSKALLLAGAPDPELKYLRRWALDAGVTLDARIAIGPDAPLGRIAAPRDAAGLAEYALAVVDERAWAGLAVEQRRALAAAVDAGMGLLLRVTGPAPAAVTDEWRTLGFELSASKLAQGVSLSKALGIEEASASFARVPLEVRAADASALLRDDAGEPLALVRARGRGRVALWWLQDSYRLALAGAPERHATLWSRVFTTLARASDETPLDLPRYAWVGRRSALCGLPDGSVLKPPSGAPVALVPDPATGARRCAAFWPEQAGWHEVVAGEHRAYLHVLAANQGRMLAAGIDRAATAALAALDPQPSAGVTSAVPWRWLLGALVLLAFGALWWLERRVARA